MTRTQTTRERFLSKVNTSGPVSEFRPDLGPCWLWMGKRIKSGYGVTFIHSRTGTYAHRESFILEHGSIPTGLSICHHCDTPPCVRASHLFAGTTADNNHDMRTKGRARVGERPCGELHHHARFTWEQVREIRILYAGPNPRRKRRSHDGKFSTPELAEMFGTTVATIGGIVRGTSWKE